MHRSVELVQQVDASMVHRVMRGVEFTTGSRIGDLGQELFLALRGTIRDELADGEEGQA